MPAAKKSDGTTQTTDAQARFVVSLPRDVGTQIDKLSERMATQMRQQFGVGVELSRAQVVTSVVQSALKTFEELSAEADETETVAESDGSES